MYEGWQRGKLTICSRSGGDKLTFGTKGQEVKIKTTLKCDILDLVLLFKRIITLIFVCVRIYV